MQAIPEEQVHRRLRAENGWWAEPHTIPIGYGRLGPRAYFGAFHGLVARSGVRRAVLLLGPRRVGKTVMIHHTIGALLREGVEPRRVAYLSIDHPLYNGRSLEGLLDAYSAAAGVNPREEPCFLFLDELQYLRDWEVHLKALVDSYPSLRVAASGSAAAALRLKSNESGAGRFTDFLLPPLTFHEYLDLVGEGALVQPAEGGRAVDIPFETTDLARLNDRFVHYLNFGGYPEVALSAEIQSDPGRFIKGDIIDKVLLRDLPSLYGIQDVQELNYLFTTLAFNTADEVSLEGLSKGSGVAKNTIRRYLEYLEAAFLIKMVHRIDRSGRRFQRANFFKVYLTNPSIRTALFAPVAGDETAMGGLAETGIFSQWFHAPSRLHYARWAGGEVDIVHLSANQRPAWAVEVKWTDRFALAPHELRSLLAFCHQNDLRDIVVTSRTLSRVELIEGVPLTFVPASLYCYSVGCNTVSARQAQIGLADVSTEVDDPPLV